MLVDAGKSIREYPLEIADLLPMPFGVKLVDGEEPHIKYIIGKIVMEGMPQK